ncbi:MAG: glycosyl transferase [Leptospiraceae bacterium]|nr:glycosyl transferase [Leptospiraceae bacterium]MCP5497607.1 glycosyl transferase [Leptospiraceae bacterium]
MNIAYYISGHGYGHISRSYEVIKRLLLENHIEKLFLCSSRVSFIKDKSPQLFLRNQSTDVGIVQNDSISMDIAKTLEKIKEFEKSEDEIIEQEKKFLKNEAIDIVVSDCSSLPFVPAKDLRVKTIFIGNFTWDFIYQHYSKYDATFSNFAHRLKAEYQLCDKALVLPFYCPMESVPNKISVGLLGRKPTKSKEEARKDCGFKENTYYFLFSFGAYGIEGKEFDFENLPENYQLVVSGYEGLHNDQILRLDDFYYPDVLTACDFVITKPGYGILSEAYFANTPVIYTERGDFPEYPYLVQAMEKHHTSYYISHEGLFNLQLKKTIQSEGTHGSIRDVLKDGREEIIKEILE